MKTWKTVAAVFAVTCSFQASDVAAQSGVQAYLTDARGVIVKDPFNLCWRTAQWTPALAIAECDPDLAPKPAAKPAPPPPPVVPTPRPAAPAPAPAPKPAAAPAAPKRCNATITLQSDQLFVFNKADLTAAATARLEKDVMGRLASCATIEAVVIEGHTDRLGSHQYNQKLSEKRAESVKKFLVSKGVDANKIDTIGMGKTVPAKFCPDTKDRKALIECLAPSRRAIIEIKGPAK